MGIPVVVVEKIEYALWITKDDLTAGITGVVGPDFRGGLKGGTDGLKIGIDFSVGRLSEIIRDSYEMPSMKKQLYPQLF